MLASIIYDRYFHMNFGHVHPQALLIPATSSIRVGSVEGAA